MQALVEKIPRTASVIADGNLELVITPNNIIL